MTKQNLTKINKNDAKKRQSTTVRCLITGFDSFGKFTSNPSQRIVETLPSQHRVPDTDLDLEIDTLVLSTCCKESWRKIENQLAKRRYNCLIMIGLAGNRGKLSLERFALNIRDYWIKDNNGHQWEDMPIHKGEAEALRTNLPLPALHNFLRDNFPVEISNHAGTFICNEVYYQGLRYMEQKGKLDSVLFVHVPQPKFLGQELINTKRMEGLRTPAVRTKRALRLMNDCILEIAGYCGRFSADINSK